MFCDSDDDISPTVDGPLFSLAEQASTNPDFLRFGKKGNGGPKVGCINAIERLPRIRERSLSDLADFRA